MAGYRGEITGEVAVLFLVLTWTTVSLRVYVRAFMTKSFGTDDYLAVFALVLFTFYCAFVLDGVHYGAGRHFEDMGVVNFVLAMKTWWIAELGYVSSTTVLKLSVGFFLLRVCVKKIHRIIIWAVMSVVTVYSFYFFGLIIFQCRPLAYFWNQYDVLHPTSGRGNCITARMVTGSTYTHGALSACADWTFAILPIFLVWDLKLNPRTKISVALILALGALGSTATIVRIPYVYQLTETKDFLYANVDVAIWSTVEPGIGITASAMATLRPLFITFFSRSRLFGSSAHDPPSAYYKLHYRRQNRDVENLGLGLSGLRTEGPTVSTTIQSMNERQNREISDDRDCGYVEDTMKRIRSFGSGRGRNGRNGSVKMLNGERRWDTEGKLMEDSCSEDEVHDGRGRGVLEVRKTTEVTTTREWRAREAPPRVPGRVRYPERERAEKDYYMVV